MPLGQDRAFPPNAHSSAQCHPFPEVSPTGLLILEPIMFYPCFGSQEAQTHIFSVLKMISKAL